VRLATVTKFRMCEVSLEEKNTVVRLSVRLSVTFKYADHTGWNTYNLTAN